MQIYNTLTKKKEEFIPLKENHVGIYQCGPTVYWTQHIGNMRASFVSDIVNRTFQYLGYEVNLVRNYTDVGHLTNDNSGDADSGEDRMDKAAKRENSTPEKISRKYIEAFERDIKRLNILEATTSPKATEHIKEMQEMIQVLLDEGYAYSTPLAVYFIVSKAKDYTRLSGQKLDQNIEGEGHGEVRDKDKRDPADFVLWFFKAGEYKNAMQTWKSPFSSTLVDDGEGFPGWHIECSAMSKKYLGTTLDIHMGGVEHIPVHHTNEIAQSEAVNREPFSKYWMHYEHLLTNNEKMSKSEGTAFSLSELIEKGFRPLDLRFFYLQAHYRSKQNFTWDALNAARNGRTKLYADISNLEDKENGNADPDFVRQFESKITDDFNTPQALATLFEVLKSNLSDKDKYETILDFDKILGLNIEENSKSSKIEISDLPENIQEIINQREKARKEKDWKKSDSLRDLLLEEGFSVKDTDKGAVVNKI